MTHVSSCYACSVEFDEGDLIRCHTCDAVHCADCAGIDNRTCACEPLCPTCREPPTECKQCHEPGCMLCLGNGCPICDETTGHHFDLVCDGCRAVCAVCDRDVCFEHVNKIRSVDKTTGIKTRLLVCFDCSVEAIDDIVDKKNFIDLNIKGTAAAMAQAR